MVVERRLEDIQLCSLLKLNHTEKWELINLFSFLGAYVLAFLGRVGQPCFWDAEK